MEEGCRPEPAGQDRGETSRQGPHSLLSALAPAPHPPSKSPSRVLAASSEDDRVSWQRAQSSRAALRSVWVTGRKCGHWAQRATTRALEGCLGAASGGQPPNSPQSRPRRASPGPSPTARTQDADPTLGVCPSECPYMGSWPCLRPPAPNPSTGPPGLWPRGGQGTRPGPGPGAHTPCLQRPPTSPPFLSSIDPEAAPPRIPRHTGAARPSGVVLGRQSWLGTRDRLLPRAWAGCPVTLEQKPLG